MKKSDIKVLPEYYVRYIDEVDDVDLSEALIKYGGDLLVNDKEKLIKLGDRAYAPEKWSVKDIIQRQRQCLVHMAAHGQAELVNVDLGRNERPMPAYVKLIVGGEDAFVEDLKRSFQKRRTGPLQDHRSLLRKGGGDRPLCGAAADEGKLDQLLRPRRSG